MSLVPRPDNACYSNDAHRGSQSRAEILKELAGGHERMAVRLAERFLCDVMLGRLARWLRTLGYDTAYDPFAEDHELLLRAARERRTLLTRDTRIIPPASVRLFRLGSAAPLEQVRELVAAFAWSRPPGLFRRCTICNAALRRARPEQVAPKVPDFVRAKHAELRVCTICGRVYWPGTHRREMQNALAGIFPDLQEGKRLYPRRRPPGSEPEDGADGRI